LGEKITRRREKKNKRSKEERTAGQGGDETGPLIARNVDKRGGETTRGNT